MKKSKVLLLILIFVSITYVILKVIASSIFINNKDRINVVFYGSHTTFYSLRMNDVSYYFSIPSNLEVEVPGGYGYYRIGALGKLISLEKNSDLFRKTFSSVTSSFVDLYFYPKADTIYYDEKIQKRSLPSFPEIFMNKSNANPLDKLLIWFYFLKKSENQYKEIGEIPQSKEHNRALLDREAFFKLYQGYFYKKTHRIIRDRVQILYTKDYKTALLISNMLDGEGIQVADISQVQSSSAAADKVQSSDTCVVIENSNKASVIGSELQKFFNCRFRQGETEVSDIILVLGDIENEWSVK